VKIIAEIGYSRPKIDIDGASTSYVARVHQPRVEERQGTPRKENKENKDDARMLTTDFSHVKMSIVGRPVHTSNTTGFFLNLPLPSPSPSL
jgi:hypothetical protein